MTKKNKIIIFISILLITAIALIGGCEFFYEMMFLNEKISIYVFGIILTIFYLWILLEKTDSAHLKTNGFVFMIIFCHAFNMAVIVFGYKLPAVYRPVCAVPMLLTILFGTKTGLASMIFYSIECVLFGMDPVESLLLFMIFGVIGSFFAVTFKNTIKLALGAVALIGIYATGYIGLNYYALGVVLPEDLVTGLIAGVVQIAVFLVFFPFVATSFGFNFKEKLNKICKDDFEPVAQLKERSHEVYVHVRSVAKLVENIKDADIQGVDIDIMRAGAIYHEIGQGLGGNYIKKGIEICEKYKIPECVQNIINEHNINVGKPKSKEAGIVMLADTVISSIDALKKKNTPLPEKSKLIDKVISLRISSGALDMCDLTPGELNRIKAAFCQAWRRKNGDSADVEVDDILFDDIDVIKED
ncbi:MAG: HDIG domain-containing protein [Lachnospiraceae bacterium]|nr:HDIG domain-containing protein [Lachnospiraceae bacterium]